MMAIAKLIEYYTWRDVALVFVDDDLGTEAIPALDDAFTAIRGRIFYKAKWLESM